MKNDSKTKKIDLELLEFQLNTEPSVVLNQTIVNRYLKAKRIIDEILGSGGSENSDQESYSSECEKLSSNSDEDRSRPKRIIDEILEPDEPENNHQENYPSECEKLISNSHEEPFYEITQASSKSSTETTLTSNTLESCGNYVPALGISIKDEISDRESPLVFCNDENFMSHGEVQFVEIPFDSNIVLNPMNNRFSFSQIDPIFVNTNEDDVMNANTQITNTHSNSEQLDGPKYLYNPMNNIITSAQTNEDSNQDDYNNNPSDGIPADVQFAPGEYTMEDSFLNENYNVVNTFALEPMDMEPNQNTLPLMEQSSKEPDLAMQFVDTVMNPDTASDDTDLANYDETSNSSSRALVEPFINEQEDVLYNHQEEVETDLEANICSKCNKKFKVSHYLKRHELTCGMTFHYNCLFCSKTSMLSHTIKCHMANRHGKEVAVHGMKEAMEAVIKRRKENKETNMNSLQSKENQAVADMIDDSVPMNNCEEEKKNNKQEEDFSNLQNSDLCNTELNFKPSKEYVDALCSNCNLNFKNLKSATLKCCTSCQSSLIYKCAVCRKCFSKYRSICGHVKSHSKSGLHQNHVATDNKHYCGYCDYETIHKGHLLRHILGHVREKAFKIKIEYSG